MPQRAFRLAAALPNSQKSGLTLIEVMFVAAISVSIMTVFISAMSIGQLSTTSTTAQADLQAEVRRTMDWIVKDARQAVSWNIADNNPTPDYIKFRQVTGWDTVNNSFLLSNTYIEYTYNSASNTITRRTSDLSDNTIGIWTLSDVISSPFFTRNSSDAIVPLNKVDLGTSRKLVITISGQKQVIGAQNTTYSLTEEVRIRNG